MHGMLEGRRKPAASVLTALGRTFAAVSLVSSSTRLVEGRVVPAVGTWKIDPDHAYIGFSVRRLGVATVHARFGLVSGHIDVAEDPSDSAVEVVVSTASVESGSTARDDRLRSAEHLDVTRHPTAAFRSTGTRWDGRLAHVAGQLTLAGVTNAIELDVTYCGTVVDPWEAARSVFTAGLLIDREDWGLTWNVTLSGGEVLVSRHVRLTIEVETVLAPGSGSGPTPDLAGTRPGRRCRRVAP